MSESSTRAQALAKRLSLAADLLFTEVSRVPADAVTWKPADDVWSVMEILCHVDEFVPYWTSQTLQVARHPNDVWGRTHTDTARLDAVQRASARPLDEVVKSISTNVRSAAAAIGALRDAELDTEALSHNPRWARKPATFVAEHLVVEHVEKHAGQIRRNVTQFQEQKGTR